MTEKVNQKPEGEKAYSTICMLTQETVAETPMGTAKTKHF